LADPALQFAAHHSIFCGVPVLNQEAAGYVHVIFSELRRPQLSST
jgi:hypothetical protein